MKQQIGTRNGTQIFTIPHYVRDFDVLAVDLYAHTDSQAADVQAFDETELVPKSIYRPKQK